MTKERVVEIATAAAQAHNEGKSTVTIGGIKFLLNEKGMCAKFIRQVHEAALGLGEHQWAYRAANAMQMEANLKQAGLKVDDPKPGDIVCLNKGSGENGHIAIYVDKNYIAENTSSSTRGTPRKAGTKLTPLSSALKDRVTGYYAAMPASKEEVQAILIIEHGTGKVLGSFNMVPRGNHIDDQGKVYVKST